MVAVAGLVLMAPAPLLAQTSAAPIGGALSPGGDRNTPAREANIYDHQDHQPTAAEVGATMPSPASTAAVEQEVEDLLKQADMLDRQSEEQDEGRQ